MSQHSTAPHLRSFTVLVALAILTVTGFAQPRWNWVKTAIGPSFVELTAADLGPDGDVHINGTFVDSVDFGTETVISNGNYDNFTARYDATGKLRRSEGFGGLDVDDSRSIAVDNKGNVYVCGSFFDQAIIGPTVINAIEDFGGDMYLAKFDKVGILQWVKVFGSPDYDEVAPYVAVDSLGSVYLAGGFGGTAQFGSRQVTSRGKSDIFVAKISALGDVTWVKSAGARENDQATGISVSANGDRIYTVGVFQGVVSFEVTELSSLSNSLDLFLWTHNANGEPQYVRQFGHREDDRTINCASTGDGKVVITGALTGTTSFHDRQIEARGEFFSDVFLSRFDKIGSLEFVETYGDVWTDVGMAVAVDDRGSMFVTGYFDSTSSYGGTVITSRGERDIFVMKAFPTGEVEWVRSAGGVHVDEGRAVMVSPDGIPYVAGIYDTEATFGDIVISEGRLSDGFLAALECGPNTDLVEPSRDLTICEGQDSTLALVKFGYPEYQWYINDVEGSTTNQLILDTLQQGEYTVYCRVTDFYNCSLHTDTLTITVTEGLPEPLVTQDGDMLVCSIDGMMYQWFREGAPIDGATGQSVQIDGDGNYQVRISNEMGCTRISDNFLIGTTSVDEDAPRVTSDELRVTVYPNPFINRITVRAPVGAEISITDVTGRTVARTTADAETTDLTIDGASGVYVVAVRTSAGTQTILSLKR